MEAISQTKKDIITHYSLPLAHPLSAGFNEIMLSINYEYNSFFVNNRTIYYQQKYNDSLPSGVDILNDELQNQYPINSRRNVLLNHLEIGYRFNRNTIYKLLWAGNSEMIKYQDKEKLRTMYLQV